MDFALKFSDETQLLITFKLKNSDIVDSEPAYLIILTIKFKHTIEFKESDLDELLGLRSP